MKRKIFYCIVGALIISVLLILLTLKITTIGKDRNLLILLFVYFFITLLVLISILDFFTEKTKINLLSVLDIISAWLASISFIVFLAGAIKPIIKATAFAIFGITALMSIFLCFILKKYEESEKGK